MDLHLTFSPGWQQADDACRYFMTLGADLVEAHLPPTEPRQYVLNERDQMPLPLRIWTVLPSIKELTMELAVWLRTLQELCRAINLATGESRLVRDLSSVALEARHGHGTLFIEVLHAEHAFTDDEDCALSVIIIDGRTVMLSAQNLILVELARGLHGLSIASRGSYLVETDGDTEAVGIPRPWPQDLWS